MRKIKVDGFAFVCKFDGKVMEDYDHFEQFQVFETKRAALMYAKKIYTKKAWPNYKKDIKLVPCTIIYEIANPKK